jgi:hypothetical protein
MCYKIGVSWPGLNGGSSKHSIKTHLEDSSGLLVDDINQMIERR